jgi:hypothetical protein
VQLEPGAGDQLCDRVRVQLHDLADLLVGEQLELTQREHLALALWQRRVRGAQLLARGRQQRAALRIILEIARFGPPRFRLLCHGFDPAATLDHVVAGVASDGE